MDELRKNIIDIWTKFPTELCAKIVAEFDDKIKICQKEKGAIINESMLRKYKENNKAQKINYNWEKVKRIKIFRVVYNDKMVLLIKKKLIQKIKAILKEKIQLFKKKILEVGKKPEFL